jgi:hypothetical protein
MKTALSLSPPELVISISMDVPDFWEGGFGANLVAGDSMANGEWRMSNEETSFVPLHSTFAIRHSMPPF